MSGTNWEQQWAGDGRSPLSVLPGIRGDLEQSSSTRETGEGKILIVELVQNENYDEYQW